MTEDERRQFVEDRDGCLAQHLRRAGWLGTTAKELTKAVLREPEFARPFAARRTEVYASLARLEKEGVAVRTGAARPGRTRPMRWAHREAKP